MVIGEPTFSASLLPWHNLLFWFSLQHVIPLTRGSDLNKAEQVGNGISLARKTCQLDPQFLMPKQARLWVVPVYYHDLWKIRAPLHEVEGFFMNEFPLGSLSFITNGNFYSLLYFLNSNKKFYIFSYC